MEGWQWEELISLVAMTQSTKKRPIGRVAGTEKRVTKREDYTQSEAGWPKVCRKPAVWTKTQRGRRAESQGFRQRIQGG